MRKLADLQDCRLTESLFPNPVERIFWLRLWSKLAIQGIPDSWAYRWTFTCLVNSGLSIIPNRNLVRNIGFDQLATHTHKSPISTDNNKGLGPIKHPQLIISDYLADQYTFSRLFAGKFTRAIFLLSNVPSAVFRALINRAF